MKTDFSTDTRMRAINLADEHWEYICGVIEREHPKLSETSPEALTSYLEAIEYHFKTAFVHGYKHAIEDLHRPDSEQFSTNTNSEELPDGDNGKCILPNEYAVIDGSLGSRSDGACVCGNCLHAGKSSLADNVVLCFNNISPNWHKQLGASQPACLMFAPLSVNGEVR